MSKRLLALWVTLGVLFFATSSRAAPEAHIIRIDPRAGMAGGQPELTTLVEFVQFSPLSEVTTNAGCGAVRGDGLLDCVSNAVSQKGSLWKQITYPEGNVQLLVTVDGASTPAKYVSRQSWAQAAAKDPTASTAWLIALDASSAMGPRYEDARQVANQFIGTMGPHDMAKLIIFDDRMNTYVANSPWTPAAKKADLTAILAANSRPSPSSGAARPLGQQLKGIVKAFGDLGNAGKMDTLPMLQTMVFLSNGAGRQDASSASPSAEVLKQVFLKGRFPEENTAAPKTPLPVISIYFPNARGMVNDAMASNDLSFMQDLATPEVGGYFDIVKAGQGITKAPAILAAVKSRFNQFWLVKWRLSCLSLQPEQTFKLVVQRTNPPMLPDASFKDVPIGVDPTQWPLDINMAQTKAEADANPVHPGGTVRIYGDFCWGGDKQRAEAYFIPAGTRPDPNVNRNDPELAKRAMQNLIAQGLKGNATEAGDTYVTFQVPDEEKMLEGQGDNMITRLVVVDNRAKRASGVTAESVITLKATKKPLNLPLILGGAGLLVVILLLVVVLMRGGGGGGGGKGKRGQNPPPAPVVAGGGGYGPPPYGGAPPYGGGPPPGGGYGGGYGAAPVEAAHVPVVAAPPPMPAAYAMPAPEPPRPAPPPPEPGGVHPLASAGGAPVAQVRCPACGMTTMATPGQASVCFSCGQPLPRDLAAVQPSASAASGSPDGVLFPLTGAMPSPLEPPPNPYGPTGATILGAAGQFAIRGGVEVKVGRDAAQCPIALTEPRVSGVHATLKFEGGRLHVRDEASNNGTYVEGARIPSNVWVPIDTGARLRFGPIEFTVRIA